MPRSQTGKSGARQRNRFPLETWEVTMPTSSNYLVKGILPRTGLGVAWGPPKCGKSFKIFDLVMHVALGRKYRGRKVRQGNIVYCALEGGHGFRNRMVAWRKSYLNGHDRSVPFYLMAEPLNLITDYKDLITDIDEQLGGDRPAIIVIDTLNRALIGDENKSEDMAKLIKAADALRTFFGCLVLFIHHCGIVGSRPRGHPRVRSPPTVAAMRICAAMEEFSCRPTKPTNHDRRENSRSKWKIFAPIAAARWLVF